MTHEEAIEKESWVLCQKPDVPAVLIKRYNNVISIRQEDGHININREMIDELCKQLKKINK